MSPRWYHFTITSLLLALLAVNAWVGLRLDHDRSSIDQAASASLTQTESEERYVSLLDIISASLDRIRERAAGDAALTAEIENSPAANDDDPAPDMQDPGSLADAIVNIYCTHETDRYRRTISGTGFVVSRTGVILTNAHVAQFLLLNGIRSQGEVSCQARTGRGAVTYPVDLLYISPSWLIKHAHLINDPEPRGTGENDFALLHIAEGSGPFAFIPPAVNDFGTEMKDRTVILVGYPSDGAGGSDTSARSVATTTITEIYTFDSGLADIFSVGATRLGQHGVSGGPVIDHLGRAIGVITTKEAGTTILHALTTAYINREISSETGFDLASTLRGDPVLRARIFNETVAPILRELLAQNL